MLAGHGVDWCFFAVGDCLREDGAVAGIPGSTLEDGGCCRWRVSRWVV